MVTLTVAVPLGQFVPVEVVVRVNVIPLTPWNLKTSPALGV